MPALQIYLQANELRALVREAAGRNPADGKLIRQLQSGLIPAVLQQPNALAAFNRRLATYAIATGLPALRAGPHLVTAESIRWTGLYQLVREGARCCTIREYLEQRHEAQEG